MRCPCNKFYLCEQSQLDVTSFMEKRSYLQQVKGSSNLFLQSSLPSQTLLYGIHWSVSPHWNSSSLQGFGFTGAKRGNIHLS